MQKSRVLFFGTKPYDKIWFEPLCEKYGIDIHFTETRLNEETAVLAKGFNAVCIFVNDNADKNTVQVLYNLGVRLILLRCAGFNNVDLSACKNKITVLRVPGYSPEAVAEYSVALLLAVNRKIHRAYIKTREFNMSINGLMGTDLHGKTAGIIGTGKIGIATIKILQGFGMNIIACDPYPNKNLDINYVSLDELLTTSDVISLHCPLTKENYHIINKNTLAKMKNGIFIINTSRGALIDTEDLLDAIKEKDKIGGVGLDVYEEEDGIFYEDLSDKGIQDDNLARLVTFPNVIITSHQGYFTKEAMKAIAITTIENLKMFENGDKLVNEVNFG
jgi:D-lactate dehydrogenase